MLSIHLQNLSFFCFHGLYAEEKILGNRFEVNVTVKYKPLVNIITLIDETINYQTIFEIVEKKMLIPTEFLETLAMDITNNILTKFTIVTEVDICIKKQHPPIQNLVGNVAVSYFAKR
jgi:7,8-dihydroneopterin aldolase/epimerase/oxygenase